MMTDRSRFAFQPVGQELIGTIVTEVQARRLVMCPGNERTRVDRYDADPA